MSDVSNEGYHRRRALGDALGRNEIPSRAMPGLVVNAMWDGALRRSLRR